MSKHQSLSLERQLTNQLSKKLVLGKSRHTDKNNGVDTTKYIYSKQTYETYKKQSMQFIKWVRAKHPECTKLKQTKKCYQEYLNENKNRGLSAWTLNTQNQALIKALGIKQEDRWTPPKRERQDIKRSRQAVKTDKHFSEEKNAELVDFLKGTGLRRHEALQIKANCLISREQIEKLIPKNKGIKPFITDALANDKSFTHFVYVPRGKGGKERLVPVLPNKLEVVKERFEKASRSKDKKVWNHISKHCDVHGYRADYAAELYRHYARDTKLLKTKDDRYVCRKEQKGRVLDKPAMTFATKALGHNRRHEVAKSYSYKF